MTHFAQGWPASWVPTVSQLNITTVRDELYWANVEATQGQYSFNPGYENYMSALKQNNISPFIILDFENPNYDSNNTPYDQSGYTGYSNYAKAVLSHYGSEIQSVEIWNEYNGTWCQGPATNNRPSYYTQMLQAAYSSIKAVRPDVTVAGGSTAGIALPYWEQLMQDGALSSMDVESIHPYRYNQTPEGIEDDIIALQNLTKTYNNGATKPIWVSEIGWEIQSGNSTTLNIDATTQAKYLARCYALLLSAGVQRVYWYDFSDDVGLSTMGLTDSTGTPRASGYALQTLASELANATFVKRELSASGLYSELFQRADGTQVRVMWSLSPVSFAATGVSKIVDLTNNPVPITGTISLTDSPIYVEGNLNGLPAQAETPLADAETDFSAAQGNNGWSYGYLNTGASYNTFQQMGSYTPGTWNGPDSWLQATASDQHPSDNGSTPVSAVRRWTSTYTGTVHVTGQFVAENAGDGGDGVGVTVLVNGQAAMSRVLIGNSQSTFAQSFDFTQSVKAGDVIDFVVDDGPSNDSSYDACAVYAKIAAVGSPSSVGTTGSTGASGSSGSGSGLTSTSGSGSGSTSSSGTGSSSSGSGTSVSASAGTVLANSVTGFSGTQSQNGWQYGEFVTGTTFGQLPTYNGSAWGSQYPYMSITSGDQHPSVNGSSPVSAVRRWVSNYAGTVEIAGQFNMENTGGDGVGVTVLVDGQPAMTRTLLGTSSSAPTQQSFDLVAAVQVGSTIDFVLDPGPGSNINFDATALTATVTADPAGTTAASSSSGSSSGSTTSSGSSTSGSGSTSASGTGSTSSSSSSSSTSSSTSSSDTNSASGVQANPVTDFALTQGQNGWSYGYYYGIPGMIGPANNATLTPMTVSGSSWVGPYTSLGATAQTLSPSATAGIVQVEAVKRWTSNFTGNVQVSGSFQIGHNGDGVGVSIMVNGQPAIPRVVIGNSGTIFTQSFNFTQAVTPGTTIDFVVDCGPGRDYSYDATTLNATITSSAASSTTALSDPPSSGSGSTASTTSSGSSASATSGTVLASLTSGFSTTQGQGGLSYGSYTGNSSAASGWAPLGSLGWACSYDSLGVSASILHPSVTNGITQIAAVKRWTSSYSGYVDVVGSFSIGHDGDGVGVTVLVNGQPAVARTVIGNSGSSETKSFSFVQAVKPGDTIDFAVDPGPGRDFSYDGTTVAATITESSSSGAALAGAPTAANAVKDFSTTQGQNGWTYGYYVGAVGAIGPGTNPAFTPLSSLGWVGTPDSLAIGAGTQHPAVNSGKPVSAVTRWTATAAGNVLVSGSFNVGESGSGVGVAVLVNGQAVSPRVVIGGSSSSYSQSFSFTQAVQPGTTIDFAVDPGPGSNASNDDTAVAATITSQ